MMLRSFVVLVILLVLSWPAIAALFIWIQEMARHEHR